METECTREQDVLDAVAAGRWPERCDRDLREHAAACRICQDAASVFAALSHDRDAAWEEATVPPASVVWWRAQIRAREEAARRAAQPIVVAQGAAVACLIAAALALVPLSLPAFRLGMALAGEIVAWVTPRAAAVSNAFTLVTGTALPFIPFVAGSILLAPIVLYLALTEE